jgi:hypothetical protein
MRRRKIASERVRGKRLRKREFSGTESFCFVFWSFVFSIFFASGQDQRAALQDHPDFHPALPALFEGCCVRAPGQRGPADALAPALQLGVKAAMAGDIAGDIDSIRDGE